ncbi:MAG: TRAM domain-containing protein [Deltaproteobacteria bacterium]|nr:TRAM domain-containing protein [Deltaproteobacteria bacterium]
MRIILVIFGSASGYFIAEQILGNNLSSIIGLISGFLISIVAIIFEERVKRTPIRIVIGGAIGLITGLIVSNLISYPIVTKFIENNVLEILIYALINCLLGYIGLSIGMKKGDEFDWHNILALSSSKQSAGIVKILDTSAIIDGRIADITDAGFIEGEIIVPQFVLQELQHIADSQDAIKRVRGKRGLDVLQRLQKQANTKVAIIDNDFLQIKEVDAKLVALGKEMNARIVTNDSNLNKIAELQGVSVLNINHLANILKPVVLPGEVMNIFVLKEGKEDGQGIGYLDDGTMVVVDNAKRFLGKNMDVVVTSILQTTGGRMIFSRLKDDARSDLH